MRHGFLLLSLTAMLGAFGCGDSGTAPDSNGDGERLAAQFEHLADSVDDGGYSPTAEALRHAAEIVRLTGHATSIALTIDGKTRDFLAVAEQIDFPDLQCSWPADSGVVEPGDTVIVEPGDTVSVPPPGDSTGVLPPDTGGGGGMPPDTVIVPPPPRDFPECTVRGIYSMRTLIAWEPDGLAEVVRIVADVGNNAVQTGVPDVMTGLPAGAADPDPGRPDSAGGGGEYGGPGFMGEYLLRDVGSWWAAEGSQSNALEESTGACTSDRAAFDWAEFSCEAARFRFEFTMRVEPLRYEPLTGVESPLDGAEGSHAIALGSSRIDGVRLAVIAWAPPPLPPVDTVLVRPASP